MDPMACGVPPLASDGFKLGQYPRPRPRPRPRPHVRPRWCGGVFRPREYGREPDATGRRTCASSRPAACHCRTRGTSFVLVPARWASVLTWSISQKFVTGTRGPWPSTQSVTSRRSSSLARPARKSDGGAFCGSENVEPGQLYAVVQAVRAVHVPGEEVGVLEPEEHRGHRSGEDHGVEPIVRLEHGGLGA
jgi:hypothetical protein